MTTVSLQHPIADGPLFINELTYRKITFGDMPMVVKAGSLIDLEDVVQLVAQLSNLPKSIVAQIEPADFEAVITGLTAHIARHMAAAA